MIRQSLTDEARAPQTVRDLITASGVAMLTTVDDAGRLASRPMLPLLVEGDSRVHFLTHASSEKIRQVALQPSVAVTVSGPASTYLALTGRAVVSHDRDLIDRLWNPTYRAWFPDGAVDQDVAVLSVTVERADFWEAPTSRVTRLLEAIEALVTHRPVETPKRSIEGL
jgi:general stress protein 26